MLGQLQYFKAADFFRAERRSVSANANILSDTFGGLSVGCTRDQVMTARRPDHLKSVARCSRFRQESAAATSPLFLLLLDSNLARKALLIK